MNIECSYQVEGMHDTKKPSCWESATEQSPLSESLGASTPSNLCPSRMRMSRISKSRSPSSTTITHTMICNRCLRTAIQRPVALPFRRAITTTPIVRSTAAPRQGNPDSSSHTPSAATSTGAAQPFSTPLTVSPSAAELQAPSQEKAAPTVKSSVAAGTPLKGLNFIKGKNDPVALEDGEYPSWLWGILKKKAGESATDAGSVEGDLFCTFLPFPILPSHPLPPLFGNKPLTSMSQNSKVQKTTPCSR
jgi:hypothetical protein